MQKFFRKKNKGGFTLVETLVAISIFTASTLGLLSILSQGISDTGYAKKKMAAAYLAQEGIEYVRNMRDTYVLYTSDVPEKTWASFKTAVIGVLNLYPVEGDPDFAGFDRTIQVESIGEGDEVNVLSTVEWTQGSGTYNITFSENLFNWVE